MSNNGTEAMDTSAAGDPSDDNADQELVLEGGDDAPDSPESNEDEEDGEEGEDGGGDGQPESSSSKPTRAASKKKRSKARKSKRKSAREALPDPSLNSSDVICASLGMTNVDFEYTPDDYQEITSGKVSHFLSITHRQCSGDQSGGVNDEKSLYDRNQSASDPSLNSHHRE